MAHLLPTLKFVGKDGNGEVLPGGKLYSYQAGTTTPLATYTDSTELTPNTNPIILDSNGEAEVWIGSSAYKFVLTTSSGTPVDTWDNVSHMANGSVTADKIASGAVTTVKIANLAVTTGKIEDAAVTTDKIASNAVTTAKIADSNVTTAKIADSNVTTDKIASGAVTEAKIDSTFLASLRASVVESIFANWSLHSASSTAAWSAVAASETNYVAVADTTSGQLVMRSSDGSSWTNSTLTGPNLYGIAYGNSTFVIGGNNAGSPQFRRSTDGGVTWTTATNGVGISSHTCAKIVYGNGVFVSIGSGGGSTQKALRSTDDGANWANTSFSGSFTYRGLAYGNSRFVAVGDSGRVAYSTDDGANWTLGTVTGSPNLIDIAYGTTFVAISTSGGVYRSADGITWTAVTNTYAGSNTWSRIAYGNGVFTAVAESGTVERIMISSDQGLTWNFVKEPAANTFKAICYGQGRFVALSNDGSSRVMRSLRTIE